MGWNYIFRSARCSKTEGFLFEAAQMLVHWKPQDILNPKDTHTPTSRDLANSAASLPYNALVFPLPSPTKAMFPVRSSIFPVENPRPDCGADRQPWPSTEAIGVGVLSTVTISHGWTGPFPAKGQPWSAVNQMPLVRGSQVRLGPWKDSAAENGPGGGPLTHVLPEGLEGGPSEHKVLWRGQAGVPGLPSAAAFNLFFHPEDPADYSKRAQPDLMRWVVPSLFSLSSATMTEAENVASEVARIPTLPFSAGAPRISPNSKII